MVNVHKWKTDNICQNLLELTAEKHQEVYGDQGVLNLLFENKWKKVSPYYNFMVGLDTLAYLGQNSWDENYKPAIIHFEGEDKPWNNSSKSKIQRIVVVLKWFVLANYFVAS